MASRSVATSFVGMSCIRSAQYGFVHGPSPAVATVSVYGRVPVEIIGSEHAIRVDQSLFVGFVTNVDYDYEEDSTTIRMLDWRDRLRDVMEFGCFNMQDDNGLWYHIELDSWENQERSYISRSQLTIESLNNLDDPDIDPELFDGDKFKSSLWILEFFAERWGITLSFDQNTRQRLASTIPDNVDFNGGLNLMDIMAMVVEKAACQFACYGRSIFHVTMRGVPTAGIRDLVLASIRNPCNTGAHQPKIGMEINEQSRKIVITGDRNQHEWIFPCAADWNENFTWDFAFGEMDLRILKEALDLTGNEKLSVLPAEYHDNNYWPTDAFNNRERQAVPASQTRNEMTIHEYIAKVPFRCYRVDPRWILDNFETNIELFQDFEKIRRRQFDRTILGLDDREIRYGEDGEPLPVQDQGSPFHEYETDRIIPEENEKLPDAYGFPFPLSSSLVTNTQMQFVPYISARDIPQGWRDAFAVQRMMVPLESGVSLQVEERMVLREKKYSKRYIFRLLFNEVQPFVRREDPESLGSAKFYEPDYIGVRLSFDKDIFKHTFGETGIRFRVRERKVAVRNLYEGYVNGELQPTIRELKNTPDGIRNSLATAIDIADRLAKRIVSSNPINISGSMKFLDRAGLTPDGLIDSVAVSVDDSGIAEVVNYTDSRNIDESFIGPSRIRVQGGDTFRNELIRDALQSITVRAMRDKDAMMRVAVITANALWQAGAYVGNVLQDKIFSKDGVVHVGIDAANMEEQETFEIRSCLPLRRNEFSDEFIE